MAIIEFKKKSNKVFQFRIDIAGAKPPIWRRVQVEADITFEELHFIIQDCFDWQGYHLHHFLLDQNTRIADTSHDFHEDFYPTEYDEKKVRLTKVFKEIGDKIIYEYDFGDDWEHIIKLEKILDKDEKKNYPNVVTAKRLPPIEDCGGIWGWEDLCKAMSDKNHPEREDMIEWYGEFDPNDFGKEDIKNLNEYFEDWKEHLQEWKELGEGF